jgi:hypothetical protein
MFKYMQLKETARRAGEKTDSKLFLPVKIFYQRCEMPQPPFGVFER